jgi:hypothetical protein
MSAPGPNPLSYNAYIQTVAGMAVYNAAEASGVWAFTDAPAQLQVPMILNYAELRIQRDLDLLSSQSSNTYTLTALAPVFSIPVNDFFTVQTVEVGQLSSGTFIPLGAPLVPVSKEFIQNCYSGQGAAGTPGYFAMYGDNWQDGQDTYNNVLLGPMPNYAYTIRITGSSRSPSLYAYASIGIADTSYTYISTFYPDLLIMASMIYISAFQRNFSATAGDVEMAMSYEKQYQILRTTAFQDENKRKFQASAWSPYSTPTAATPTR